MSFFTVIVPCYNSEKTIERALSSFERQTYNDFEVIVIDDCSTDGTINTILSFALRSKLRIKLLSSDANVGPSRARQRGIEAATSSYVCFCDSDDEYEPSYLDEMRRTIEFGNFDMVFCDHTKIFPNQKRKRCFNVRKVSTLSKKQLIAMATDSLCCCCIRRNIIASIDFPNIRNGEDMAIIPILIQKSDSFGFVEKSLYNYYCFGPSLSKTFSNTILDHLRISFEYISTNLPAAYKEEVEFLGIRNYLYASLLIAFKNDLSRRVIKDMLGDFNSVFPKWTNNAYFRSLPFYKRMVLKSAEQSMFGVCSFLCKAHGYLTRGNA